MKQTVIAMKLYDGEVSVSGCGEGPVKMKLPKGCIGLMFCFESKKTAREYWGRNVNLVVVEKRE